MTSVDAVSTPVRRLPRAGLLQLAAIWLVALGSLALVAWIRWTSATNTLEINRIGQDATTQTDGSRITLLYASSAALNELMVPSAVVATGAVIAALGIHAWLWSRAPREAAPDARKT